MYKGSVLIAVVALSVLGSSSSFGACTYTTDAVINQEGTAVTIPRGTVVHFGRQTLHVDQRLRYSPDGKRHWEPFRTTIEVSCSR